MASGDDVVLDVAALRMRYDTTDVLRDVTGAAARSGDSGYAA